MKLLERRNGRGTATSAPVKMPPAARPLPAGGGAVIDPGNLMQLRKILADLEADAPNDPSLPRLRAFIVSQDRKWLREDR